jgi:hypothetical protein
MCGVLVAIDGQPRGLLPNLFEVDDRRVVLVLIISIKPDDDGKGALPLEADEIIAGDVPHIHDLSESRANGHELPTKAPRREPPLRSPRAVGCRLTPLYGLHRPS